MRSKGSATRTRRNQPWWREFAGAVSAAGLQGDGFDHQLGALHQGVGGDDFEAKSQRVWFDARGNPDLDHDPSDLMHAFLAGAFDNKIDNTLAQRQLMHWRSFAS